MKWAIVFVGRGVWGPFPSRRVAVEWADQYARENDLHGSFLVQKMYAPKSVYIDT